MVLRWAGGSASRRMAPFDLLLSARPSPCPKQALAISPTSALLGFYRMPLERAVRILASRANPLALRTPFFLDSPICACPRQILRHSFPPLRRHPLKKIRLLSKRSLTVLRRRPPPDRCKHIATRSTQFL